MSSDIAVILVHYHCEALLARSLAALDRQTLRPRRVIVVNNGGGDDLAVSAKRYYPTVEILGRGENLGFAAANNLAIRAATDCRWVALLNADAFAEPTWLEELARAAENHRDCQFFGGPLLAEHDTGLYDGTGDVYHVSGRAWRRDQGAATTSREKSSEGTIGPCAAAALYLREALVDVGGFDERYFCYFEDVDLNLRLRMAGYRYGYVPAAVVHHVGSAVTGLHSDFYVYHGHRNLVWTYWKNMPGRLFWRYLPQHLLLNLLTVLFFATRGKAKAILRAKLDAFRQLPSVLRARRTIQQRRRLSTREAANLFATGITRPYRRGGVSEPHSSRTAGVAGRRAT
jgi:GT2 family glycosyltransferase